ncbi:MAG: TonB-dependent receptor [Parvularculaceae bacterium]
MTKFRARLDFGTFAVFSRTIETNRWMWKATLDYAPSEDILLYATVSRGFKSGGFNGAAAQTHSQLLPIKPETLTSYEAGMKSTLFRRAHAGEPLRLLL